MKKGYKASKSSSVSTGLAKNVNVVNKPTVKVEYEKPAPMPPTLRLSTDDLPAIANWKVGSKYKLTLEVEQTSLQQGSDYGLDDSGGDSGKTRASFKVLSVGESK